ncbi:multidrug resistance protein [Hortaea werneckii]|nr:multidrug resistance protein [Hortaea werneckii]KAI7095291.1 multidrug resistance protein [Hortaea werneckii]KAI7234778.1 multidrug resistance protein [Hortaea werneckii]KAI7315815.1 multidrug resistance protein [Hortaea werneckii]KAI7397536.1 multidrug resistance protein [Hortaea werneckii]
MAANEKEADCKTDPKAEEGQSAGGQSYVRVFQYADRDSRLLYATSCVAAIGAGVALPFMDLIFGKFVTTFNNFAIGVLSPSGYMSEVEKFTLYFVYLFIAKFVLTYIHSFCVSIAAIKTTKALREHFLQTLLRQEITFFDSKDAGSPSVKVTTNGNLVNNGISDKLSMIVQNMATFVAAFVIAFAVQWKLTLITICIVPVIIVVTGICSIIDIKQEAGIMSIYSRAGLLAEEVFSTMTTVHAFFLQPLMAQRYDEHLAEAETAGMKKSANYGIMFSTQFFCIYAGYGLAFWRGIAMYASGEIDQPGKIVTVIFALILAAIAMSQIAFQIVAITKAASAASELFTIIDRESAIDPLSEEGIVPDTCAGNIEVRNIAFSYPSRPDSLVLNNLVLDIPAKKTTALVGASGSGKSTIIGLLERWYDQNDGVILVDGVDVLLFSGTVFDNVAHGLVGTEHENASQEKKLQLVEDACKEAFADDFIKDLPEQYFTQIGERARMLSGGQKQRIAIARSIISNPPILLLDEATSALDPRAEKIVQEALEHVSRSRTTLTIAHKLSTIQKADNIAVMAQGVVIEQGTHTDLLTRNGAYARLVSAQSLERKTEEDVGGATETLADGESDDGDDHRQSSLAQVRTASSVTPSAAGLSGTEPKETKESMGYSLIRCLLKLIREQPRLWLAYSVLFGTSLGAGGTWPAQAVLFSRMFGTFQLQGQEAINEGNFWALMFFVLAIANLIIYFAMGWVCNVIMQKVTRRYRLETFNNTAKQDITFFDQESNSTGAITSRLSTCATDLQELLGFNAGLILNNIVTVISCAILGIAYGWKLGLVCTFGALPPMLVCGYARIRLEMKLDDDTAKRFASSAAVAAEAVGAVRTVASLCLEETVLEQYRERLSIVAAKSRRTLLSTMFWYAITQSINFLAMALGFWYGGKLVSTGEYTTEQFFVVFIAIILGGENAAQFFSYTTSITKAQKAANYIFWLRSRTPAISIDQSDNNPEDDEKDASVECAALEFAYPSRPNTKVIKGIDVNALAGKFVALVGPSGCGKSTMVSLLTRLYDPSSGYIAINDQNIKDVSPRRHRRRLALVQQEPVLYSGSIRENISMGLIESHEPSEAQIEKALRSANIFDFVQSLPEGLHTSLGNRGTQLSGGQRQRIAIARALIRDPRVLLLDEATSALDTESEKVVQAALMDAAKDGHRSTIAVAHRLSTIKDADVIYVFQAGRIVESGTHATLTARRGVYYEMCQGQALDKAAS